MLIRALLVVLALLPAGDPEVDAIVREEREHSRVMEYLDHLVNDIGPRLTGSTRLTQACEWAAAEFGKMGLQVRLERWGSFPVGFDRGPWSARMIEPEAQTLTIGFNAWSPGTEGTVTGPAVLAPASDEELAAVKGKLRGAWVISSGRGPEKYRAAFDEAGIAGVVRTEGNELIHTGGRYTLEWDKRPTRVTVTLLASQHQKIVGLLKQGKEVKLAIDIHVAWKEGPIPLFNVVAELPGSEKPDERVVVGGHLDSWDGATGATDNGTGVATTLEAARLITRAGVKPRRTVRFMLWSGEEQGLLGSRAYIKAHPEESSKISAVIVHDGGTNYASGINATEAMVPVLEECLAPLKSLDEKMPFSVRKVAGLPRGIGSDHDSYLAAGVPGFFWLQSGRAKYGLGHHTQNDVFDQAIPEYQRHTAMVVAIAALRIADLPELLPRQGLTSAGTRRRMLGVSLDEDLTITDLVAGGAAEKAGVKAGDRILRFNGQQVGDDVMLRQAIQSAPRESKLVVERAGKEEEIAVTFGD